MGCPPCIRVRFRGYRCPPLSLSLCVGFRRVRAPWTLPLPTDPGIHNFTTTHHRSLGGVRYEPLPRRTRDPCPPRHFLKLFFSHAIVSCSINVQTGCVQSQPFNVTIHLLSLSKCRGTPRTLCAPVHELPGGGVGSHDHATPPSPAGLPPTRHSHYSRVRSPP